MALDKEFFDSVNIDVVKKKYYNANKVNALLDEIRSRAGELSAENAALREQLGLLNRQKSDIGDTLMSAQALAKQIVEQANAKAEAIIREAELRGREIESAAAAQQEHAVRSVEACFDELKQEHLRSIELINARWQQFLCGIMPEEQPEDQPVRPEAEPEDDECEAAAEDEYADEDAPQETIDPTELEMRVAAIAKELRDIIG